MNSHPFQTRRRHAKGVLPQINRSEKSRAALYRRRHRQWRLLLTLAWLSWSSIVSVVAAVESVATEGVAAEGVAAEREAANSLGSLIQPLIDGHHGQVAVAIKHLEDQVGFQYKSDKPMPTASLIKFPLMVAAYEKIHDGELSLQQTIPVRDVDQVAGSGILQEHFSEGSLLTLRDAIQLMIVFSDNTATNMVIDQVGLPATAELMERLDCPNTKLHSKVFRRDTSIFSERSQQFGLGSTTPQEMVKLLELLYRRELFDREAGDRMWDHLVANDDRTRIGRSLPAEIPFAHKTGAVTGSKTDAGVIESPAGPIAICVLTTENEDRRWVDDNEANVLMGEIGLAAYRFFNPDDDQLPSAAPQAIHMGSTGDLVEALQRTLNARLKPSMNLSVDGDFGPMTLQAVIQFQKQVGIDADGEVTSLLWEKLGTLITESEPVPDPAEINSLPNPRTPAGSLDDPPFVTCKAWAIGDGETGERLWGHNDAQRLDMASTTKIMTGLLVTTMAEQDASVLEETVVFTQRADETTGSTSGVRAGERLSVDELLYGLLLPSGNDASVALGEHFGGRLTAGEAISSDTDPLALFIQAMNRHAKELGMKESSFRNTHGITELGHMSSARDLLRLGHTAMSQPTFRKYTATPQRGCQVIGEGGYQRNLWWKNTNRLLKVEGFDGIKTGTTNAAGSCLVSRGHRDGRSLIVVVLGSSSSDARYTDSRNLYRWAWRELGLSAKSTE